MSAVRQAGDGSGRSHSQRSDGYSSGVAAWLLVALLVGPVVGRAIRLRERRALDPPVEQQAGPQIPAQDGSGRPEPGEQGQGPER